MTKKNGTILITTLWILAILSVLAVGIGFRVSIEARLSKYNIDKLKAAYFAKAGIYKTRALLLNYANRDFDSIRDCGVTVPPNKDIMNIFTEKLSDGAFEISYTEEGVTRYGMADEERKININKAEYKVLYQLFLGKEPKELAASIMNWRSPTQLTVEGAQDSEYESLTAPYKCKHADFSCIEELLLVKGMTPEVFESIKDYVTVYTDGKINLNTAPLLVLRAFGLSDQAIGTIILTRNGADNIAGTKDDVAFSNISQAQSFLTDENDKAILTNNNTFTTKSNYFRIESKGIVDKSRISAKIVCIVDKGSKKLKYYREY